MIRRHLEVVARGQTVDRIGEIRQYHAPRNVTRRQRARRQQLRAVRHHCWLADRLIRLQGANGEALRLKYREQHAPRLL